MTEKEAAKILTDFNAWRRGEAPYDHLMHTAHFETSTKDIGIAIDLAIKKLTPRKPRLRR